MQVAVFYLVVGHVAKLVKPAKTGRMPKKQNARPYYNTNNIIYYYIITIITWGVVLKNTRKRRKKDIMLIGEGRVWGIGSGGGWVVG